MCVHTLVKTDIKWNYKKIITLQAQSMCSSKKIPPSAQETTISALTSPSGAWEGYMYTYLTPIFVGIERVFPKDPPLKK